jgi:photoactive yellow protein
LPRFDTAALWAALVALDHSELDRLDFGVIGFDDQERITHYNRAESSATGLTPERLMGRHVFEDIAQCMNNYLVAQRFADARTAQQPLDAVLDYVLTWRMQPTPVRLRLLAWPPARQNYLALQRLD